MDWKAGVDARIGGGDAEKWKDQEEVKKGSKDRSWRRKEIKLEATAKAVSSYRFSGSHAAASIKPRRCVDPLFGKGSSALRTAKAVATNRFGGTT